MNENGGLSASDVALMSRDGDGFGNGWGGMIWLFAILALMGGGGFGWGNGAGNTNAIQADVNRGFDNQNLQAQTRDIAALNVGQANLLANINECCCNTRQAIMQNNYDGAMRDAATNANFTAQIQSVKDMIAQDKIEALQAQVSQLQLAQATAGMLRFPNSWSYGAGPFPPIFGGCPCNNI